ncbi:MAG: hypothetical protein WCS27_17285 [Victivallaceae bacterium]
MLHLIFAELADGILKDMIRRREKEPQRNPFLQPIEAEIERLENIEEQIKSRLEVVKQLHRWISEVFDLPKTDKTDSPKPEEVKTSPEPAKPAPVPEPQTVSGPEPKAKRERKQKKKAEYQHLPKHRATGNPRLDALETALHDALERLVNTKLAFYVKDINEVRLSLIELYKSWDSPEEERLAELESGLKAAADKLSGNSRAGKSKVMQDIWSDIIVALQQKDNDE